MELVCEKCGQKLDAEDRFCKRCGSEITRIEEEVEIRTESTQPSKGGFKNRKMITAAGITIAVLVVILILVGYGVDNRPQAEMADVPQIADTEEPYDDDIDYDSSGNTASGGYDEMDAIINNASNYTFQDLGNALAENTAPEAPESSDSLDTYTDEQLWYICRGIIEDELPINPTLAIFPDWGPDNVGISREDDTVYVSSYVYADDINGNNKKQYFEITFYRDLDTRQIVIDGTYY